MPPRRRGEPSPGQAARWAGGCATKMPQLRHAAQGARRRSLRITLQRQPCGGTVDALQLIMLNANQIKPNTPVVCSQNGQFGVVDHMEGADSIKLKKDAHGQHHYIPLSWVKNVDDKIHVDRPGAQAMKEWTTASATTDTKDGAATSDRAASSLPAKADGAPSKIPAANAAKTSSATTKTGAASATDGKDAARSEHATDIAMPATDKKSS